MDMIEKVVNVYKSVTRFPVPVFAEILKNDGNFISILSKWSQSNVETGKKVSSQQIYLLNDSLQKIQDFPPVDTSHELCSSLSPCGTLKAVIRESAATSSKIAQQFIEIWHGHQLQLISNLTSLDIHGSVYSEGEFNSLVWAPSGEKVAYIAEEKVAKSEPFLPFKTSETEPSKPVTKGDQFILKPDWGEQLVGRSQPVIVVCDVKSGSSPTVLSGLPENLSPGQLTWTQDSKALVGVAWENNPRRLGLIYCTNRPGHIFQLSLDGAYRTFSGPDVAVRSPRCSPDGSQVIWLERKTGGPHHGCMRLMSFNLTTAKLRTVVNIVEDCEILSTGDKFYGLYCCSLPRRCWTNDGCNIIVNTPQVDKVISYMINMESGSVVPLYKSQSAEECCSVLDIWRDVVVCSNSNMRQPHALLMGKLDLSSGQPQIKYTPITAAPQLPELQNLIFHSFTFEAPEMAAVGNKFGAIYMGPSGGTARTVPLIVWPHGGPHSMFACDYKAEAAFFVLLGFGVLMVNYRGSIGFGEASVKSLLGHIGDNDVADMQQAVKEALAKLPLLDPEHCVLFGGSHGGFLVTHLSGQFPDAYKAVVARNPVIDIASMSCTSDIPDWTSVECGWEYHEMGPRSTEVLVEMRRKSPLWHARSVKAPTLLLVGSGDLRVPPTQSVLYYHQLKGQGTPVKMLMYDDCHPLSKVPNDVDNIINSAIWFLQHTSTQ